MIQTTKYAKQILNETIQLIQIPSVKENATESCPFGKNIQKALEHMLSLCKEMGMKTKNLNNWIGYAEYGEGEKEIAVLVHLDVVPVVEEKWKYPPFQGIVADDRIYGRGAQDDKGPAVAAVFAVKRLMDEIKDWNKRIRIIFSLDEESGWKDIDYYHQYEKQPDFAFTPDADFPMVYAEKGILQFEAEIVLEDGWLIDFQGGTRANVVPDTVFLELDPSVKDLIDPNDRLENLKVFYQGKSAHASMPEKGDNAAVKALKALEGIEKEIKKGVFFRNLYSLFSSTGGKGLEIDFQDEVSGALTLNLGKVEKRENKIVFTIDIRYPVTMKYEELLKQIQNKLPVIKILNHNPPIYKKTENKEIALLLEAYQEITGKKDQPIAIGGGTLARAFKNAVAFGAVFPGEEESAHQNNESINIHTLFEAHEIYTLALKKLLLSDEWG
ncbi:MAG: hypothetical protein A2Y41_12935 [Spirochaetes bacterium GWB1_36_13]|nr:MAG: hypothetical protein A2Y41_12935 [Spirochaetes bacterium GWB1_36_13]